MGQEGDGDPQKWFLNWGITEQFDLEGTCRAIPSTRLDCSKPCPTWPWNSARGGAPIASLGNLFQFLPTITLKDLFPISYLNLPSVSLKLLPLVLSWNWWSELARKGCKMNGQESPQNQSNKTYVPPRPGVDTQIRRCLWKSLSHLLWEPSMQVH